MKSFRGRFATAAFLLSSLLFVQAIFYHCKQIAENRYLDRLLVSVDSSNQEAFLFGSMSVAFDLPTHIGLNAPPDFGLRHPLFGPLGPPASKIHEIGGHCGRRSRLLIALLDRSGIPARKVHLINQDFAEYGHNHEYVHAVVEAWIDGRWVIADPLYNSVYKLPSGQLASLQQIQGDQAVYREGVERADSSYVPYLEDLYTYTQYRKFIWTALPFGAELQSFLNSLLGESRVNDITTPFLLESPYRLIAASSYLGGAIFLFLGLIFRRKARAGSAGTLKQEA